MGKSQRRKGHNWEREIARRLRDAGIDARRNVTETQTGNTGDVHVFIGNYMVACIQCKSAKSPSVWKAMAEAIESSWQHKDCPIPLSAIKRTAKPGGASEEYMVLRTNDFISLLLKATGDLYEREAKTWGQAGLREA